MNADRRARILARAVVVVAALVVLTGALAAVYYRPGADGELWRLGFDLVFSRVVRVGHAAAAYGLLVAAGAWVVWRRAWRRGRVVVAAAALLAVLFLATGHVVPWGRLLPWAETPGGNLRTSGALIGQEGPFPELVGVRLDYDDSIFSVGGRRFGALAVKRLYRAHVYWLPALVLLGGVVLWRRRQASPRATSGTSTAVGAAPTAIESAGGNGTEK